MTVRRRWSTKVRLAIRSRFGGTCQMCRQSLDERGFDLDHHIPLEIGGEDVEANLRPLCRPCHRLKTFGRNGDIARIAKTKRQFAKHVGAFAGSARKLQSRGFPKVPPQRTASRPLARLNASSHLGDGQ